MLKRLYINDRFFYFLGGFSVLFALSFVWRPLFMVAQLLFFGWLVLVLVDYLWLFSKNSKLDCRRVLPKIFSLNDDNPVKIDIFNAAPFKAKVTLIDELPVEFQLRNFEEKFHLVRGGDKRLEYQLRPVRRGHYKFGNINCYLSTPLGFLEKKIVIDNRQQDDEVPVYPSILQMKEYELITLRSSILHGGIKKMRRIGHSYEFEQIKPYVQGDDYRSINWKASSRQNQLMVNQYEDERAQQIYTIIDKSRVMRMPFNGMSLVDYAINSTLAVSNIVLKKYDKAGLITFSNKIGTTIKADSRPNQINKILQALYREKERPVEANYDLLYHISRKLIIGRSLLILFTNFESIFAMERMLPILRRMNKNHLLLVVFFENTEIKDFALQEAGSMKEIYQQTIAQKYSIQKIQIAQELRKYGIQSIITRPEDLTLNTINKYLELKARGAI